MVFIIGSLKLKKRNVKTCHEKICLYFSKPQYFSLFFWIVHIDIAFSRLNIVLAAARQAILPHPMVLARFVGSNMMMECTQSMNNRDERWFGGGLSLS